MIQRDWRAKVEVEYLQTKVQPVGVMKMVELEAWSTVEPNDWSMQAKSFVLK